MARKVLDCRFYMPTIFRDVYQIVSTCEKCQKAGMAINRRHEMPQQPILFCKVFDVWGIDFMGPFPVSNRYSYILLGVDYFGVPKTLISDQGSHFCNRVMSSLLHKYGVVHRIATAYHLQTNGQAEVFNREIKKTLQKMTNLSRKDWSRLLEDALWAHRIAYRTSLGMSPYQIVFDKACHLLLQELDELRLEAYENSRIYKQIVKRFYDQEILRKEFQVGQKVLLFNLCLKLIAVELKDEHTNNTFQVNRHQINLFHEGPTPITTKNELITPYMGEMLGLQDGQVCLGLIVGEILFCVTFGRPSRISWVSNCCSPPHAIARQMAKLKW
ncbi:pol, partial [Mucuna pruriens]